ncbi:MAG: DUF2085 domain-containing protein [Roseiflexaceae bacterium]
MNEDQIVARARQQVAARQREASEQRWGSPWRWLLPALILAVLIAFIAAPAPLPRKLLLAMGGVCGLRPAHSYFVGGVQLPLEARMIGIYGGFLLAFVVLLAFRRLGARRLGSPLVIGILVVFFMSMAFDGVNSTLTELGLAHLYMPTNLLRLLTGLLSGIAIAPFLLWLLNVVATPREPGVSQAVVRVPWELVAPLAINAIFAALVLDGHAVFYYPIALASVVGIVGVLAITALLVILAISGLAGRITQVRQLVAPGALALLVAFAILGATATARWTFITRLASQ